MASNFTVVPVPQSGAESDAMQRFAYAVGTWLATATADSARNQAAAIDRAAQKDSHGLDTQMLRALEALVVGFSDARSSADVAATVGLRRTTRQHVLEHLVRADRPMRPSQLDDLVDVTSEHLARSLKALERDGLAIRVPNPIVDDGRATWYAATDKGRSAVSALAAHGVPATAVSDVELVAMKTRAARALLKEAQSQRRASRRAFNEDADATVERVIQTALAAGDEELAVDAIGERATALRLAGRPTEAEATLDAPPFTGVLDSAHRVSAYAGARRLFELGKLRIADSGTEVALPYFTKAEELLRDWPNSSVRVWNALAVSECQRRTGELGEALKLAEIADEAAARAGDEFAQVRTGLRRAFLHRLLGQPRAAIAAAETAARLAESAGLVEAKAECDYHHGEALRYQGDIAAAKKLLRSACTAMNREDVDTRAYAFALSALGACEFDAKSYRAAERLLKEALIAAGSASANDAAALTRRRLGVLYAFWRNAGESTIHLRAAKELYASSDALSLIGAIECDAAIAMAANGTGAPLEAKDPLLEAEKALESLTEHDWTLTAGARRASERVVLLDSWVYRSLLHSADTAEVGVPPDELKLVWRRLHEHGDGIAAWSNTKRGKSPMGKEPVHMVYTP